MYATNGLRKVSKMGSKGMMSKSSVKVLRGEGTLNGPNQKMGKLSER